MQSLKILLKGVEIKQLIGNPEVLVKTICHDSRAATQNSLFVALPGTQVDGHAYIAQAIEAGSKVIVCQMLPEEFDPLVTYLVVAKSSLALGLIAANFYDHPSKKLKLVAVTGTSGKTTTVHLLYGLFKKLGYQVGLLSTIYNKLDEETLPATLTTPDVLELNELLARMVERGCQYCFMEASSHAIFQNRIAGLHFVGATFLNISHDHLDYHQTFDAYIQAKKKLFDNLPANAFALYNADGKQGKVMVQNTSAIIYSFAMKSAADFTAKLLDNTWQGLCLRIAGKEVWFRLLGAFNAANLLAVYAIACLLEQDRDAILIALSSLSPVVGRFQCIQAPNNFVAIIDYAHKPDALEKVLVAIKQMKDEPGKIITVVGCGGNRDKEKRPKMAHIAGKYSDRIIFTSDNPRDEDPQSIIREMMLGLSASQQHKASSIVDRKSAIKLACQLAHRGDVVLIAGKGHEQYQEIKGKKFPLDDAVIIQEILSEY